MIALPVKRRALLCEALADDLSGLRVAQLPLAPPGTGEVAVRVCAAALNYPDYLMTQGRYQHRPEPPFVPGMEAAGEVLACGAGVDTVRPGEAVVVHVRTGAFADHIIVPAHRARAIPAGLDWAEAAAHHAASITAYVSLVRRADARAGETLLVHGASGGVGMAAVQLGRHLGMRVIATGTADDKLALLRERGADETINLREGLRERAMALTGGRGVDVVFDPVGGDVFDASLRCLGWGGRLLVIGFVAGRIPEVKANYLLIKGISVIGVRAGEYGRRDPVRGAENVLEVDRLATAGVLRPWIGARFPLEAAVDAFRAMAQRRIAGKIVIEP
jgi:NADPH2:quinone reductase